MTTLEKIRTELHATAEMHEDGDYYLRDKWVDEIIDKYAEQEPTDEWQNGYNMAWEEAEVFYEQEPCDDAISREAVVDDFIEWREKLEYAVGEDYSGVHLLNVAIQKIWDMPTVTPKPIECDDAVSRQAVLEIAKQHTLTNDYLAIQNLPSVRPQEQTKKESK